MLLRILNVVENFSNAVENFPMPLRIFQCGRISEFLPNLKQMTKLFRKKKFHYTSMETTRRMKELVAGPNIPTDAALKRLIEGNRLGMQYRFDWNPRTHVISPRNDLNILCQANTVVLFFVNERVAISTSKFIFQGATPILPKTVLVNDRMTTQLKYRCLLTHQVVNGALLVCTELELASFQIVKEDDESVSLLEMLSSEW